ncbi:ZYBA0S08-00232g1_1 [Zygosaccharomyces bailii CLIB 213]|uniref:Magnesium transporter n=1 Tax=Zygosaccharomyces bailii (strain CLIB 213 / ATCC 58445 / CBS 680 / BCRC 21525 / NBRC 1098 / NCYC 1416 / NRRL Y-2227) TaxID=1333698 RepID=A0A8J2T8C0_ZYGB2|nr:ZYBA0S08-00232g1_1 [Zygosaccharomyces bailii CLIB 213]
MWRLSNRHAPFISRTIRQSHFLSRSDSQASILLQKNLIQRNNALYNYGSGAIRCTIFDKNGQYCPVEIKRKDLVTQHELLPRDLRKIERSRKNDLVPSLLVRQNGILISLLTIRALIKPEMVIVFDSVGSGISLDSRTHKKFIQDLELRLNNQAADNVNKDTFPYEFRALESIFVSTLSNLSSEMKVLQTVSNGILEDLEYSITRDKLRFLLVQNKKLTVFRRKALLVREMLNHILEQDDVLCEMYLTDKLRGKCRSQDDHEEIEMLLETYYTHVDEVVQTIEGTISNVKTTEEIINIILDSNRNQLMLLGIRFGMGMLSLGVAIWLGSLYGMNLENFIEDSSLGFIMVAATGMFGMSWLFIYSIRQLHRLQKMSLVANPNINIK